MGRRLSNHVPVTVPREYDIVTFVIGVKWVECKGDARVRISKKGVNNREVMLFSGDLQQRCLK